MAACSSGNSSPLVVRISYDELVAYADELDKKNETKHSKKKHHGKLEEKDSKPTKVDKKTDVSKNVSQTKAEEKEEFGRKETKVNHQKHKEGQERTKIESKKEKRKSPASKPRRKSSSNTEEDDLDPTKKRTVTNNDKIEMNETVKVAGKRRENARKETRNDEDEKEHEKYELDLRARTGGVLKLSKEPVHVAEESPKGVKPRGIIKLPEGFNFNSHDRSEEESFKSDTSAQKRIMSENCSSRLYDSCQTESSVFQNEEVHFSGVNEQIRLHQSETTANTEHCTGDKRTEVNNVHSDVNSVECVDIPSNSVENEQEVINETKAEKTLKSINQQKAQRLIRVVAQKEMLLSNLVSRGILNKAAFQKICTLSKEIQDTYKGIMMLDIGFAAQQDVDQNLWRNAFYKVIETLRKYGKLFLGYEEKTDTLSPEEISNCLKEFLKDAEAFYKSLLEMLQKGHDFSVQDIVSQPRKAEKLGKNVSTSLLIFSALVSQHCS